MRFKKYDPEAAAKVKERILDLMCEHERMKAANAHYRKHRTMAGFDNTSDADAKKWDAECKLKKHVVPYPANVITNSGARIRKLKLKLMALDAG